MPAKKNVTYFSDAVLRLNGKSSESALKHAQLNIGKENLFLKSAFDFFNLQKRKFIKFILNFNSSFRGSLWCGFG